MNNNNNKTKNLSILLIDDDEGVLEVLSELLQILGHHVKSFNSPFLARTWLLDHFDDIDLVITDERMPGDIQGHHLVQEFGDRKRFIMISGYIAPTYIDKLDVQFLQKPVSLTALVNAIEQFSGSQQEIENNAS